MLAARKQRLWFIIALVSGVAVALTLILYALQQNINLFYSPSQIAAGQAPINHLLRVGGIVQEGSLQHLGDGLTVTFIITDYSHFTRVKYTGMLPALFRPGQGIVAEGMLNAQGEFIAQQVLAKHDANYMPPEVAAVLHAQHANKST